MKVVRSGKEGIKYRGLMLDVTDRKKARALLRQSEQRNKRMIAEAPYGISIYNQDGLFIAGNAKHEEIWQIELKSHINRFNILKESVVSSELYQQGIHEAFSGKSGEIASEITFPNASKRWFNIKYYPIHSTTSGKLDNVVFITEDISDFTEAQEELRLQEALKQNILDALSEAILVINKSGEVIGVNKNLRRYVEKEAKLQIRLGQSIFDFISVLDNSQYLQEGLKSVLAKKIAVFYHEMKLQDKRWYSLRATPLNSSMGAVIAWQNINTRKEIEMALEKSLKKYRNIYSKAPVMMHSMNKDLEIISVSDFWLEKMGFERNEVIGKSPVDFLEKGSKKIAKIHLRKIFQDGEIKNVNYRFKKKSGEIMDVLLSAVAEFDERGNFERSITGMIDVTNLKAT
ncbi:MAG: PAS domain S-box protein, partial [Bacteroidota bacterium]